MLISVAMATYNGETYLKEQLQSLADQIRLPDELVVGDDGSSDATLSIVEDFRAKAPFPVHIHRNKTNLGYARNFLATAKRCQGDWIAFCDQDDVWLENKLHETNAAIQSDPRPVMILQNSYICDENLSHQRRIFPNFLPQGYYAPRSQYGFWVWPGFLKTVRADVFLLDSNIQKPRSYFPNDGLQTHDKWTCMIANSIGGFLVLSKPVALYRRHDRAVTGAFSKKSFITRFKKSFGIECAHYRFLAEVANETKTYLYNVADHVSVEKRRDFQESAEVFEVISKIQKVRSNLYETSSFILRAKYFMVILKMGGYFGPRSFTLTWRSAAKDFIGVLYSIKKSKS
jgi:glycosyltransferase involved in cell wall biosynthesis